MPGPNINFANYEGNAGSYRYYNGPSLEDGAAVDSVIQYDPMNVDWIRNARQQSVCVTNMVNKSESLRKIREIIQEGYDTIKSYGSSFAKSDEIEVAINTISSIESRLKNLSRIRLDSLVNKYNNNIEYYRIIKIKEAMKDAVHKYNYSVMNDIENYSNSWYYYYSEEDYGDYESYKNAHERAVSNYTKTYYSDYPIRTCDHGEKTLLDLKSCSTITRLNRHGADIYFDARPDDTING